MPNERSFYRKRKFSFRDLSNPFFEFLGLFKMNKERLFYNFFETRNNFSKVLILKSCYIEIEGIKRNLAKVLLNSFPQNQFYGPGSSYRQSASVEVKTQIIK